MSSNLFVSTLECDKNKDLNWNLGKKWIKELPDLDVLNIYSECMYLGEEYLKEDLQDQSVIKISQLYRDNMLVMFDHIVEAWNNNKAGFVKIELKYTDILIAAGNSWGDSIPECDTINFFLDSGLAEMVGFVT
jgi:hypothetical protein